MPAGSEPGSARVLACLYSSKDQRELLEALCGLEREIGASLATGLDHHVAHVRLAWWREECERAVHGQAAHPFTRAIVARTAAPARAGLMGLIDTATWDLARATFESRRELTAYAERWSAAMIATWAQTAAPAVDAATLRRLGQLLRETELLLALPAEARAGRLRLPLDELEAARSAPEELAHPPWKEPLSELLRERHQELRTSLQSLLQTLPESASAPLRPLRVWVSVVAAQSRRAQAQLPRAAAHGGARPWPDAWQAWRAARRAHGAP
jgi:15-cis-phytoene synthase